MYSFGDQQGGYLPSNTFTFGGGGGGDALSGASLYSPFLAGVSDTHKRNLMPLKVGMIHQAFKSNPQAVRIILYKEEVGMYKLVGLVRHFQSIEDAGAQKFLFDLEDATGSIKVEWLTGILSDANSPWLTGELKKFAEKVSSSTAPVYVKVFGETNIRGLSEPSVKANTVLIVDNFWEIIRHDLQVASQHIKLSQGPSRLSVGPQ